LRTDIRTHFLKVPEIVVGTCGPYGKRRSEKTGFYWTFKGCYIILCWVIYYTYATSTKIWQSSAVQFSSNASGQTDKQTSKQTDKNILIRILRSLAK